MTSLNPDLAAIREVPSDAKSTSNPQSSPKRKVPAPNSCRERFERRAVAFFREQYHWRYLKLCQVHCVAYIVLYTYGGFDGATVRQPGTGHIVDQNSEARTQQGIILMNGAERSIVATSTFQLVCLSIARVTAFYMYPTLVLVFFSKLRATTNFIAQTPFGMFLEDDWHDMHVYCGWSILVNSVLHTVFHVIRYADQGNLELLVTNRSGLSGVIVSTIFLSVTAKVPGYPNLRQSQPFIVC